MADGLELVVSRGLGNGEGWWREARGMEDYGMCCRIAIGIVIRTEA